LLGIFACPGDVFDDVAAAPPRLVNWRLPTLLVCLAGIASLRFSPSVEGSPAILELIKTRSLSLAQTQALAGAWPLLSSLAVCLAAVAGSLWSACVLWLIGRFFLRVRFSFLKALEVVGLSTMILLLGTVVTMLLTAATQPTARPSLAFLAGNLALSHSLRAALDTLNLFHLWTTAVLAIGLAKLCAVTFKEAAFWVFNYWLLAKLALIVLK
jgi:hypothetical protein